ncbi:isoaspartyl peptidase/L-asparaginase-like isoform X2 [Acanthaster planci]|uniref:Isoaspartyl peptidase/L-asparaginase-like isoform X2 n=1 Tax=Acanthaster planci TaxID=133434 RepID=A0A8B7YFI5_ACAPL|nr:isoaspartyl peptidase/L-asparaginase-like isoform X2 [Acanthaster planci]
MSSNDPVNQNYPSTIKPVVLVHGGAWAIPDGLVQASCQGVQNAAREGYRVLEEGGKGTALDAVVAAVCILEDDPAFDAGTGSVLNEDGEVEMDAIVMEGQHLKTGAVACVKNIRNPVKLARLVMEKTEHILLVGDGANKFAKSVGMKEVPVATLVSDNAVKELEHFKKFNKTVDGLFSTRDHDTVGAVAVDSEGNVACATSTGGITAKMAGRVGDSPLIGSGAYCDSAAGSASATGHGESIAKVTLARQVVYNMQNGASAQEAAEEALSYMSSRASGAGGTIAVDNMGNIGVAFTTARMPWAWARSGSLHYGINPGEDFTV